jgi:hypothetical protein
MALDTYFSRLLERINASDIQNNGKDDNGFYKPTRELLIRHATLLRDLHAKPLAKPMVKSSWAFVVANAPPEWLVLEPEDRILLKNMLTE